MFPEYVEGSNYNNRYSKYILIKNRFGLIGFIDYQKNYDIKVYFIKIPFINYFVSFQNNPFGNFRLYNDYELLGLYKMFKSWL